MAAEVDERSPEKLISAPLFVEEQETDLQESEGSSDVLEVQTEEVVGEKEVESCEEVSSSLQENAEDLKGDILKEDNSSEKEDSSSEKEDEQEVTSNQVTVEERAAEEVPSVEENKTAEEDPVRLENEGEQEVLERKENESAANEDESIAEQLPRNGALLAGNDSPEVVNGSEQRDADEEGVETDETGNADDVQTLAEEPVATEEESPVSEVHQEEEPAGNVSLTPADLSSENGQVDEALTLYEVKVEGQQSPEPGDSLEGASSESDPPAPTVTRFAVHYLGSTVISSPEMPTKEERFAQTGSIIKAIKQPEGEPQPSVPVTLEVSIQGLRLVAAGGSSSGGQEEELMSHPLVTVGFVADFKDLLVILMRKVPTGSTPSTTPTDTSPPTDLAPPTDTTTESKQIKMRCHLLQTPEANKVSGHVGGLFHRAYKEYLRRHRLTEPPSEREDYDQVLRAQEPASEDLDLLVDRQKTREIVFPKKRSEPLGLMLIESGFGSPVPACVVAAMSKAGAAHHCGLLNVGDHILTLNGVNFVGLAIKTCMWHVKKAKMATVVKMEVAHCPPVVELKIYRPDVKYNLGFCIKNGLVQTLYRGSIADRCGVRVGHQIIELNGCSVVDIPHDNVVKMLQTTVGHIHIKTMSHQIFRLMTGKATPEYA